MNDLEKLDIWLILARRAAKERNPNGQAVVSTKSTEKQLDLVYSKLSDLLSDPKIQPMVKEFNKNTIVLNSDSDIEEIQPADEISADQLPPPAQSVPPVPPVPPDQTMAPTASVAAPTDQAIAPAAEEESQEIARPGHAGPSIVAKMAKRALSKS